MGSKKDVRDEHVQTILQEWHEAGSNLYATVFDTSGMQTCAGRVTSVDDEVALIADSFVELRIPYASAGDCAVASLGQRTKSITLTWHNGTSAFLVTRSAR